MPPPSSAKADESRGLDELVVRQREGEAAEKPKAELEGENHCFTSTEDMNDDMENQMTEESALPVIGEVDSEKEDWVKRKDHQGKDKRECEQEENSGLWHATTGPAEPCTLKNPFRRRPDSKCNKCNYGSYGCSAEDGRDHTNPIPTHPSI